MRQLTLIPMLILLAGFAFGQSPSIDKVTLEKYKTQTERTDPGIYSTMFDDLPGSIKSLCSLIKQQLLHPQEAMALDFSMDEISNDGKIPNVEEMLKLISAKDNPDLNSKRPPKDRLVLACYHHSILLASILRHQGIPVRLRAGYSRFFEKQAGVRFGHIICEVWDLEKKRWILVDPDREIIDMKSSDFEFASAAFLKIKNKKTDEKRYIASVGQGFKGSVYLTLLDASFVLSDEKLYYDLPEILLQDIKKPRDIDPDVLSDLEEIAENFKNIDAHLKDLNRVFYSNKSFKPSGLDYESYYEMITQNR